MAGAFVEEGGPDATSHVRKAPPSGTGVGLVTEAVVGSGSTSSQADVHFYHT